MRRKESNQTKTKHGLTAYLTWTRVGEIHIQCTKTKVMYNLYICYCVTSKKITCDGTFIWLIFLVIHDSLHALKASIFEHKCSATGQLSKIVIVHVYSEGTFLWPELMFYSSLVSQKRLRLLPLAVCYSAVNGLYIIEFDKTIIVKLHSGMVDQTFSHTRSGFPLFLSRMPIPARGEYKNDP